MAWLCHVAVNARPFRPPEEQPAEPRQFNPLRLAEVESGDGGRSLAGRRGGLPLDVETVRAVHAALVRAGKTGVSKPQAVKRRGQARPTE